MLVDLRHRTAHASTGLRPEPGMVGNLPSGGQVGPGRFSRPEAVVHIDRVYLPALQPRIAVPRVELLLDDGRAVMLMRAGRYLPHLA